MTFSETVLVAEAGPERLTRLERQPFVRPSVADARVALTSRGTAADDSGQ